jgi:hypothetical protein
MKRFPADERKTTRPHKFNMAIIYEAPQDGIHAKSFGDRLIAEVANEHALTLGVWSFQVLGIAQIRNIAASAAAIADVVILSMSGTKPLSPQIEEWLELWCWLIDQGHPAVFALFGTSNTEATHICADLQRTALRKGLDFFAGYPQTSSAQSSN